MLMNGTAHLNISLSLLKTLYEILAANIGYM